LLAEYLSTAPTVARKQYGYRDGKAIVMAEQQVNIATLGTATQSSTDWSSPASRGNDGNTDGNWANNSVTHTMLNAEAWWHLDLGSVQQISSINVWNRTDCCSPRLSNFYVFVLDNAFGSKSASRWPCTSTCNKTQSSCPSLSQTLTSLSTARRPSAASAVIFCSSLAI
jgi:hypothetical protein